MMIRGILFLLLVSRVVWAEVGLRLG
jgi:hypothetical protein